MWKAFERKVADFFNTERSPLSGSNGKQTRSDSLHPDLYIECKYASKSSLVTLYIDTDSKAVKEKKLPIMCHKKKGQDGFLVTVHSSDMKTFMEILNQYDKFKIN